MMPAPSHVTESGSTPHSVASSSTPHTSAVYSSGAISEASPRRNASVIAYWPSAPAIPTPRISQPSTARSGTQPGIASTPAPTAIIAISHTIIDCVLSVRASTRTVIALTAYISAATSTASAARLSMPSPVGRSSTSTPMRPTPIAVQRRGPTFSPSIGTDSTVISSGATKKIEYAVDNGRLRIA